MSRYAEESWSARSVCGATAEITMLPSACLAGPEPTTIGTTVPVVTGSFRFGSTARLLSETRKPPPNGGGYLYLT